MEPDAMPENVYIATMAGLLPGIAAQSAHPQAAARFQGIAATLTTLAESNGLVPDILAIETYLGAAELLAESGGRTLLQAAAVVAQAEYDLLNQDADSADTSY